jgi:hypothetical protein
MPKRDDPSAGDPQASLEQVFRGDHAIVKHSLLETSGVPKIQPIFRKNWSNKQARNVILTLAPVELDARVLTNLAVFLQTGPVTGLLTWGIEGADAKEVEFDWGSAFFNSNNVPDGRGSGLQLCFPASYVQLDARNWMGTSPPLGGFPDSAGTAILPRDAILRAFLTVGAATQRLTPITRTFWYQLPIGSGAGFVQVIPPMAKRVQVTRSPALAMTVEVANDPGGGNPTDQVIIPAGGRCPIIDLPPDASTVSFTNNDALNPIGRARIIFELAI